MKQLMITICVIVLMFSFSGITHALPGTYMFTMPGNDSNTPESEIEQMIDDWFKERGITHDAVQLEFHAKFDTPAGQFDGGDGGLTVGDDGDAGDLKSGSWASDQAVEFYSVKAGSGKKGKSGGFAFYWLGFDGASKADWTTEELGGKGLSHLSVWNPIGSIPPAIPEPGTIFLLSAGLLGLLAVGRRRLKK